MNEVNNAEVYAPAAAAEAEAPKKKSKTGLIIALICVAALAIGVGAYFLLTRKAVKPLQQLANGARNTVKAASSTDVGGTVDQMIKQGSLGISVDLSKAEALTQAVIGYGMTLDAKVDLTAYFKENGLAAVLSAKLKGSELLDGTLVLTKDELALASKALLGREAYGIALKDAAENLKNSVFNPENGSDLALTEEDYEVLLSILESLSDGADDLSEEVEDVLRSMLKELKKSLEAHAAITRTDEALDVSGTEVKTACITVELGGDDILTVAKEMIGWIKENDDVRDLFNKLVKSLGKELEKTDMDPEELIEAFYDKLDEMLEELEDAEGELDDVLITVTGHVTKKGNLLVQLQGKLKNDEGTQSFRLTVGPDPADPAELSLVLRDVNNTRTTFTYTVEDNSKTDFKVSFKLKEDSDTIFSGKITWDKAEGDFKLTAKDAGDEGFTLTGTILTEGSVTTIRPKTLEYASEWGDFDLSLEFLTVTVDEKADFPETPDYTEVLTMSEDELGELLEDLQKVLGELMQALWGSLF